MSARIYVTLACVMIIGAVSKETEAKSIGILIESESGYYDAVREALEEALDKGVPDSRRFVQAPGGNEVARCNAARRLSALGVDVIVTLGARVTKACVLEVSAVPVVFGVLHSGDFSPQTLKKDRATGVEVEIAPDRLVKSMPAASKRRRMGVVYAGSEESSTAQLEMVRRAKEGLGAEVVELNLENPKDLAGLNGIDGLLMTTSDRVLKVAPRLAEAMARKKIPVAALLPGILEDYGVITLAPPPELLGSKVGEMALQLLEGRRPGQIPPVRLTQLEVWRGVGGQLHAPTSISLRTSTVSR